MSNLWELIKLKQYRKPIQVGDIFVIQPFEEIYFFGKVFLNNAMSSLFDTTHKNLICIYQDCIKSDKIPQKQDKQMNQIMVFPRMVSNYLFSSGYLYVISNQPLTEFEKNLDYGIEEVHSLKELLRNSPLYETGIYVDAYGNILSHKPKYRNFRATTTQKGIGDDVQGYIAKHPESLHSILPADEAKRLIENAPHRKESITLFQEQLLPFIWTTNERQASLTLFIQGYKDKLFQSCKGKEFVVDGYAWEELAKVYIEKKIPAYKRHIHFDSEKGMFCVYANDKKALKEFSEGFRKMCNDNEIMRQILMDVDGDVLIGMRFDRDVPFS